MAAIGRRDSLAPRARPEGAHGAGGQIRIQALCSGRDTESRLHHRLHHAGPVLHRQPGRCWWLWRALLLAWLSLGCGIGTTQVPAPRGAMWGPEPPTHTRPRRQPAQGAWGPWGPWSVCSSSCGDGVAFRTRRCLRSAEEEPCTGDQRQYRLCQLQGCPGGSVPFRAMQCSLYDDKPVQGMQTRHRWVPFYGALMGSDGRYVLNGDWSIAWPGPYEAAGTQLLYARSPDGTESLEAPGPTDEDLHVLVLLQEPNPGIEYEFWLPRGLPQRSMVDTSALRQPQPRGAGSPPPAEPPLPTVTPRAWGHITEPLPPRSPPGVRAAAGPCGRCRPPKGRSQRIRHFCQSDFVFRARILARRSVGQEMRYEVQVVTPYRRRFPMVPLEYVWVPDTCGCPTLLGGHEYVLMARRHVNYEHTLNRILLQRDGYARPWSPREERAVREAERHCAHLQ
ncbi:ADAMTS-like protein 5 isoform X3 [Lagopus muta]|uniref:ADAMTS-like protein 5 isoform X3 n=1 Tax=Lagopus muta TaxID=64668 RepID=UPI00209EBC23|nr:ADAMTS-like protein 5 isoform X3 [Lagopus muta]